MEIYTILISLCVFGVLFGSINKDDKLNRFLFVAISSLIVGVVAFRSENIGTDTPGYYSYFLNPSIGYAHYEQSDIEFGYNLFSDIVRSIYKDGNFFLSLCAFISIIPFVYLLLKESENKLLSLFLFVTLGTTTTYYILFFSMVRQCIALGIICIGLYLFHKNKLNKWYKRLIPVIIAFNFHHTSFLALPLFFIDYVKISKKIACISLILSLVIGFSLMNYIKILELLIGYTDNSYDYYVSLIDENTYQLGVTIPTTLLCIGVFLYSNDEFLGNIYVKTFFIGTIINNIMSLAGNSDRLSLYFGIYGCLVIPNFIELQLRNKSLIKYSLLILLLVYYTGKYMKVMNNAAENPMIALFPYKTFF